MSLCSGNGLHYLQKILDATPLKSGGERGVQGLQHLLTQAKNCTMSPTTTVSAVSGALVGVATTTITQASQLQPYTPWIDPTGLGGGGEIHEDKDE